MFSGLALTRPSPRHFGGLGDIPFAGWAAGTLVQYSNHDLMGNTWLSYTNEEIQAAFAASGLFVPSSVVFHAENTTFMGIGNGYSVTISGVLPVAVSQSDVSKTIEGLLANWFYTNPSTASYSPQPNATVNVSSTGQVTGSSTNPGTVTITNTAPQGQPSAYTSAKPASQYGIIEAGAYADGTTYVAFTDGNTINFDDQGDPMFGIPYGAYGVNFAIAYDDGSTGVIMNDGTELDFDSNGRQIMPGVTQRTTAGSSSGIVPVQTVRTTNAGNNSGLPSSQPKQKSGADQILDALGLNKVPLSLGVGAGVVLAGLAIGAYVVLKK